jgi:hypothetical protein
MAMVFALLLMMTVLLICVVAAWPILRDPLPEAGDAPTVGNGRRSTAESLEGVLVNELVAGQINSDQYVRAMERVAARDDERHPLTVPPETGSHNV